MSLPAEKHAFVPRKLKDEVINANAQKNCQQILDIQMSSPGNIRLKSIKPSANNSSQHSPNRVPGTYDSSQWAPQP